MTEHQLIMMQTSKDKLDFDCDHKIGNEEQHIYFANKVNVKEDSTLQMPMMIYPVCDHCVSADLTREKEFPSLSLDDIKTPDQLKDLITNMGVLFIYPDGKKDFFFRKGDTE